MALLSGGPRSRLLLLSARFLYIRADMGLGDSMFGESEGRKSVDDSFSKGMIGDEYDFVGVFNDDPSDEPVHDYEVFIVAVNPGAKGCIF